MNTENFQKEGFEKRGFLSASGEDDFRNSTFLILLSERGSKAQPTKKIIQIYSTVEVHI